jgi:hypothetical protein
MRKIVREIMNAHGSAVGIDDNAPTGTVFTLQFRLLAPPHAYRTAAVERADTSSHKGIFA